jgi:hypothetical protein
MKATEEGHIELMNLLIAAGAEANAKRKVLANNGLLRGMVVNPVELMLLSSALHTFN